MCDKTKNTVWVKDYPGLLAKARHTIREIGVNERMPGFEMLIKALVIIKVIPNITEEQLLEVVECNMSLIPSISPVITKKSPVEHWMLEAVRSIGDDSKTPLEFVKNLL